jgi:hypothetical protein
MKGKSDYGNRSVGGRLKKFKEKARRIVFIDESGLSERTAAVSGVPAARPRVWSTTSIGTDEWR